LQGFHFGSLQKQQDINHKFKRKHVRALPVYPFCTKGEHMMAFVSKANVLCDVTRCWHSLCRENFHDEAPAAKVLLAVTTDLRRCWGNSSFYNYFFLCVLCSFDG